MQASARTPREIPEQEGVDVAEQNVPGLGALSNPADVIQNPANLESAEISGQRQTGLGAKPIGAALLGQLGNVLIDARVLPNQRVVDGMAGLAIPNHRGFTLVRDADRGKIARSQAALFQRFRDHLLRPPPNLRGVVLHPSRLRIDLFVLLLGHRNNAPGTIKYDESSTGCTLIDSSDVI